MRLNVELKKSIMSAIPDNTWRMRIYCQEKKYPIATRIINLKRKGLALVADDQEGKNYIFKLKWKHDEEVTLSRFVLLTRRCGKKYQITGSIGTFSGFDIVVGNTVLERRSTWRFTEFHLSYPDPI